MRTIAVALILVACSGEDGGAGSPGFECHLGELTGTWRIHYSETNGTCGAIPDETSIFPATLPAGCTVQQDVISSDKCRLDRAFTCPTTDGLGTQEWVASVHQTGPERIEGSGTVQLDHTTLGTCRSTYGIAITRL